MRTVDGAPIRIGHAGSFENHFPRALLGRDAQYRPARWATGDGNSERLIGEVMRTRRAECVLATKVRWDGLGKQAVIEITSERFVRDRRSSATVQHKGR